MLLRSSSHPAIGTLLSPVSDSPTELNQDTSSFRQLRGFRRAWSDSNLERSLHSSCHKEELHCSTTPHKYPESHSRTMLRSAPSLSIFNVNDVVEDQDNNGGEKESLIRTITIGEMIEAKGSGEFNFGNEHMGLIEEEGDLNGIENLNLEETMEPVSPPLYLASGLGIDGIDFGGGNGGGVGGFDLTSPNFDESGDLEEYYKRMVDEFPCHPLFLANYAQLLEVRLNFRSFFFLAC